jgi:hypothetical protein
MNTNRFESPKSQTTKRRDHNSAGPGWWALAVGFAVAFVVAIVWLQKYAA